MLRLIFLLFTGLTLVANYGCKKGGSSDKKVDSTKIKDSLAAVANTPEKLLVKEWILLEYLAKKEELKDDKKYEEFLKASYLKFMADGTSEFTDYNNVKNVIKAKYKVLDGTKLVFDFTKDNKPQSDTVTITVTPDRLEEIRRSDKKTITRVFIPKK